MKPMNGAGIISDRDILIAVTINILGVYTLSLPRILAEETTAADGWVGILLGGGVACILAWVVAKLTLLYPNKSFFSIASDLVTKPIAVILTFLFTLQYIAITSFQVREVSALAHQYLFDQTPLEVISLSFLLVVVYGVCGSRAGIFRLNALFLPFVLVGLLVVVVVPLVFIKTENLLPVFQTDFKGYVQSTYSSLNTFAGFGIILFYIALVKNPKNTPKMAVKGVIFNTILYTILYIVCIGTFGNSTTANIFFPTFDLSRTVEIPGGFFERFDAFLFLAWTIILFVHSLMAFDIAVMTLMMVFKKVKKIMLVITLTPLIFFISMIPKDYVELTHIARYISLIKLTSLLLVVVLLWSAYKIKGGKQSE
ncbi:spore germination protein [Lysinibacillus composti]|uniref:Spore gernimation protein n=1 Tax=Lysinibacillus composti TaxID=720633 RepID=A0A3N9UF09_9BACI|nr:endospore germination permease [Lysinibacillus composti]MBM7608438.1 spore germination protein [Lysinibacillus composti]RQW74735.1 spore gernimation protein [Lysinibacillus composti]